MENKEKTIGEYKARRVGNALVITIPQSLAIQAGEKFTLKTNQEGNELIYKKTKSHNPWENGQFDDFDFRANMKEVGNYGMSPDVGNERVEWK